MQPKTPSILLTPLLLLPSVLAGINCEGSTVCGTFGGALSTLASDRIDPSRWYNNGEHIVCDAADYTESGSGGADYNGICAFLSNTGGAPGSSIKTLLVALENHGCKVCGSVPLYYPDGDNNDGDHGVLTVNYVSSTGGCKGTC